MFHRMKRMSQINKKSKLEFDSTLMRQRAASQDANKMKQILTCTTICDFPPSREDTVRWSRLLSTIVDMQYTNDISCYELMYTCIEFISENRGCIYGSCCQHI